MYLSNAKTIVFITGTFISHNCWTEWIAFFENKGYKAVAPPWPHKNEFCSADKKEVLNSKIATIRLEFLIDYYTEIIKQLPEKPILIGHSYGGLLAQLLMQKELGAVAVCINSYPPFGISSLKFLFHSVIRKATACFTSTKKSYVLPLKTWQEYFSNSLTLEEQNESYKKMIVPESKLILRDLLTLSSKINFRKKHEPILFLSGSNDKLTSSKLIYSNFRHYKNFNSITCYKEFKGKNHVLIIQSGWETVAEYIADWFSKVAN